MFKVRPGSQPSPAVLGESPPWRLLRRAPLTPLSAGCLSHSREELTVWWRILPHSPQAHLFTLLLYTTTELLGCRPTISIKYGCAVHPAPSSLTFHMWKSYSESKDDTWLVPKMQKGLGQSSSTFKKAFSHLLRSNGDPL